MALRGGEEEKRSREAMSDDTRMTSTFSHPLLFSPSAILKPMDGIAWILWLVIAVGLIVAEIFTLGFVLFWFGIGALAAGIAAFLGFGVAWQFAVFAIVSIALTAMSRTIFAKYLPHNDGYAFKSGIDSLPGQIGTVSSASRGALNEAAVKVYGTTWTAFPVETDIELREGEKVEVVEVRGSSILVRPVRDDIPSWRGETK